MGAQPERASLYFGQTHQPVGFTSAALAHFDGSAEPVVRELLQNSLDAANQAERVAEIRFEIRDANSDDIPGWKDYLKALELAKQERKRWNSGKPSHDERTVLQRIELMRHQERIPLLLCVDNGHGLDDRRMDALLTPGNTSKGERGAGSFGLGHHAAFGASDLRYVLYGARYQEENRLKSIASGHAILASHRKKSKGPELAADGYWFVEGQGDKGFGVSIKRYPCIIPNLLRPYIEKLPASGTVVCIVGFNDFNRDEGEPGAVEMIGCVAAANFSDAICSGSLSLTAADIRGESRNHSTLCLASADDVESVLDLIKDQKRARRGGGFIAGSVAYSAVLTLRDGQQIDTPKGIRARWRSLAGIDGAQTQVHVFRRGMWITSRADGLKKADFADQEPFDAVISLDDGELEELVRAAEGPEHRGLDHKRLEPDEKKRLRERLHAVAQLLRAEIGERDDLQEYTPPGFAELRGRLTKAAEKVRRARSPAGGGSKKEPVMPGEKPTNGDNGGPRRRGTPTPGSAPRYRSSLSAESGQRVVVAHLSYDEEAADGSQIGVRVREASGADGSCESPLPDGYLRIASVEDGASRASAGPDGALEVTLEATAGRRVLKVTLLEAVEDPRVLELDLVRRRPDPSDTSAVPDAPADASDSASVEN